MAESNSNTVPASGDSATATAQRRIKSGLWPLLRRWWKMNVSADVDQIAVINRVKDDSSLSHRYTFMIAMSAGIAILGLLLSSPAVVIGAMLLSPLMGPIMGAGFSLAIGDATWLRQSVRSLWVGTLIAILFCALVVLLSPLQTVTEEIAARTRPNLFDLAVALFSALAGSYAMIRGREGSIVGVAIATALMPPLAVVGFGLATMNWTVFGGSLLLFFTNLMTIALATAVMARLYGFSTNLSERQTLFQNVAIFVSFVALAIPLGFSLQQIAWESNVTRTANGYVKDMFGDTARVSTIEFDFDASPIQVNATVLTPEFVPDAEQRSSLALTRSLGRQIAVSIDQFKVGMGEGEADAAQIAAAKAQEKALSTEREITRLGERLALIAGVPAEDVLIDPKAKRAVVKASPLPGAKLEAYRLLEKRVADLEPGWTLLVEPPAGALPDIEIRDGKITEQGQKDLELVIWAAKRVDAPLGINGSAADVELLLAEFKKQDVTVVRQLSLRSRAGRVVTDWLAPDAANGDS